MEDGSKAIRNHQQNLPCVNPQSNGKINTQQQQQLWAKDSDEVLSLLLVDQCSIAEL